MWQLLSLQNVCFIWSPGLNKYSVYYNTILEYKEKQQIFTSDELEPVNIKNEIFMKILPD